jgi:hypothetical protein
MRSQERFYAIPGELLYATEKSEKIRCRSATAGLARNLNFCDVAQHRSNLGDAAVESRALPGEGDDRAESRRMFGNHPL